MNLRFEWGVLRRLPKDSPRPANAALSYDADGWRYEWEPSPGLAPKRFALDVERSGRAMPDEVRRLLARAKAGDGAASWTATEVLSKLTDTPVLAWIRENGMAAPAWTATAVSWGSRRMNLRTCRFHEMGVTASFGFIAGDGRLD